MTTEESLEELLKRMKVEKLAEENKTEFDWIFPSKMRGENEDKYSKMRSSEKPE